ncbi:putative LPLAT superfamily acyltransferase [Acidovorax temperans]|uniref:Putative LPLAT superfamily acyltransferase n=1 Tax=Acidovorax temperans TaxID=80878 RepID=A0A543L7Y3_9BURK|nr:acyltransferase [Acidovorax temperans]TQN03442.1 putative LPLAT superfamily acyltransferase [Acidovorax temperans]
MTAPAPEPQAQAAEAASAAPHWAQLGENTFVAGMWLLYQVHRFLGRWPFLLCLYPVVGYYWLVSPVARRASQQYLQRMQSAHGLWPVMPGWRQSQRHFRMFAQVILDKLLALSGRYRFDSVAVTGREALDALAQRGQGAVVVTAHMGCIELCRALAERRAGLRLNILVHTAHAERFNRVLQRLAPDSGVKLLQVTDFNAATAMMLAERVARGELIAIAGDRVPVRESRITHAPFLGQQAPFPCGPYILASVLECPLFFMGCVHEGTGYAVEFVPLAERVLLPRARRDQAMAGYATLFAQQLERMLRKAPYDWFNFFPFWDQGTPARSGHTA